MKAVRIGISKRSWEDRVYDFALEATLREGRGNGFEDDPSRPTAAKAHTALSGQGLERTRQAPPDGSTLWSRRKMAAVMNVKKTMIARIWKEADLKPHRMESYVASNDPHFEEKAAAILGLYLNPLQTRLFLTWMRRARFKPWIIWTAAYSCRPGGPRSTYLNATVTERCHCTRR